jgi:hypothetical protein
VTPHPVPLTAQMIARLDQERAKIPAGRRSQVSGAVTNRGLEGAFGVKVGGNASVEGYAGKEWGSGWTTGVRGAWSPF